jgi:hypothetical protein
MSYDRAGMFAALEHVLRCAGDERERGRLAIRTMAEVADAAAAARG